MALLKKMQGPLGVPLEYHRIANLNVITNIDNVIQVNSYFNREERERESSFAKGEIGIEDYTPVYCEGATFLIPYNQFMTIDDAYEYLKTLPEFEGALDC